jgi:hypothetical protein
LHCKLQTHTLAVHEEASNCQAKENPKSCHGPPRRFGRLTVGHKINFNFNFNFNGDQWLAVEEQLQNT